jgi:hypothetical protein
MQLVMYHDCRPSLGEKETLAIVVPSYVSELIARYHSQEELGSEDCGCDICCHIGVFFCTLLDTPMSCREGGYVAINNHLTDLTYPTLLCYVNLDLPFCLNEGIH